MRILFAFITAIVLWVTTSVQAVTPPAWINFQGQLLDDNGIPVTFTNMTFSVGLWTDPASTLPANLKYSEDHFPISVDDGVYSFPVGSGAVTSGTYGGSLYKDNNVLWMEITVTPDGGSAETLTPRHRLLSAPYTNHSGNAENLDGNPATYFGTAAQVGSLNSQISSINSALSSLCTAAGNIWTGSSCKKGMRVMVDQWNGGYIPVDNQPGMVIYPQYYSGHGCPEAFFGHNSQIYMGVVNCDNVNLWSDPDSQGCGFGRVSQIQIIEESNCSYPIPNPGAG